ncbi:hippocampus abundant transcript 1 protein isoform X1 [Etheostoma cragini]|uniref:hippocampus abundant transcript 1 protein isoform X1 n=2 Tax=Etheostoma cragini TaxID=417921 RepID=UPI00155E0878|nr:hippocampus abundant transcript 1 protein isoform X1 [Etheostoma cragini]XP_034751414.1 hippocampus abundant transcript 1 protein isoform X1 [Etheostoma cragini]XP_034751415.1 hippocampus abundant transcript 1 protein isoform X1 [Etheostoma cragini]
MCEEMPGEPPSGSGQVVLVKKIIMKDGEAGMGRPSVYHAVVVIFLEFFAWGLLTTPMLTVLHETFPQHTFLMNGLIQGVKGLLSFMSAPLIGALSDVWGRRTFLLVTVFFTCAPIPLMRLSPWWYFAMISMSGAFSVTFSVIFAYVADVTDERERSTAYGLVSATFAASLVTSPAIGAYLSAWYGDNLVVLVATLIALADICFILLAVPESLPDKMRLNTWGAPISWEQADPFTSLRKVGQDPTVLLICITVFLSYLPEAGQYSSFFLYLRQVINFSSTTIAVFIGVVGILSIIAQTLLLTLLMRTLGNKNTVLLGLGFQVLQLAWYGLGSEPWMMWAAGAVAAMSSITFPAVSALVSQSADPDKQGVVQGMITGIRGLCNGLGPALYGFIFFLFNVELNTMDPIQGEFNIDPLPRQSPTERGLIPGPPFLLGACSVVVAFLVALFIPEKPSCSSSPSHLSLSDKPHLDSKETMSSLAGVHINTPLPGSDEETPPTASNEDFEPLLQDSIV